MNRIMKRKFLIIAAICLSFSILCACSEKPYSEAVETFNEEMSGPYILHLAHWLGAGVFSGLNLNGDSGTGDDICQELIDYPNVSNLGLSLAGFVESPDSDGSGEIWLRIPLQDMAMDEEHNYTLLGAVTPAVGFKYNIDISGEITIGSEVDYSELDNSRVLSDGSHWCQAKDAEISYFGQGTIVVDMRLTYYDFNIGLPVSGPVRLTYYHK